MRACIHTWGWAHRQRVSTTFLTRKNSQLFLCSWRGRDSNLESLDLESDALPTEPPRHFYPVVWHSLPSFFISSWIYHILFCFPVFRAGLIEFHLLLYFILNFVYYHIYFQFPSCRPGWSYSLPTVHLWFIVFTIFFLYFLLGLSHSLLLPIKLVSYIYYIQFIFLPPYISTLFITLTSFFLPYTLSWSRLLPYTSS